MPVSTTAELIAALAMANPGDVITLDPGTYVVTSNIACSRAGELGRPITVRAATLGSAVIESSAVEGFHVTAPYWTFENLEMRGTCANDSSCEHAFHITGHADGVHLINNRLVDFNAQVKSNGAPVGPDSSYVWPDNAVVEGNELFDTRARNTSNPVTKLDIVGGNGWRVRANYIHDFHKGGGDNVSYAAFLKGNSVGGLMERNLVVCSRLHTGGTRLGLSLGGGGTSPDSICQNNTCSPEHQDGMLRNNIIAHCSDVGIYLNEGYRSKLYFNTLYDTAGIDVRYTFSTADVHGNLIGGILRDREGGTHTEQNNLTGATNAMFQTWFTDPDNLDFSLEDRSMIDDLGGGVIDVQDDYCGNPRPVGPYDRGAVEYVTDAPCDTRVTHPGEGSIPTDAGVPPGDAGFPDDGGNGGGGCCGASDRGGSLALAALTLVAVARRRRRRLLAVAALSLVVACKKSSKPPADAAPVAHDAAALVLDAAADDDEPGPLTPPVPAGKVGIQVIGLEYEGHEAKLLPAIRADGAQIAALWVGDDGGRGYLDLKLQLVDTKTGKVTDDRRLVDPEETTAAQGDDGSWDPKVLEAVKKRVADTNAILAAGEWRALESHLGEPTDPEAPIVAAGINWSLESGLHLVGKRAGKIVFDRTYTQLTGKKSPRGADDDDMCPDVIILSAIHVDEPSSHALIAFGRQPGHNCGAPGDDLAVITLPPK